MGITVSTGAVCDSKTTAISHVLESMQVPEKIAKTTIRIPSGADNIHKEAAEISQALRHIMV